MRKCPFPPFRATAALFVLAAGALWTKAASAQDRSIEAVPVQAAPAPRVSPEPAAPAGSARGGDAGERPVVRFGAMVGLVSLPRPLDVAVLARIQDLASVGIGYSQFPGFLSDSLLRAAGVKSGATWATLDDFSSIDADLRVFPFFGSFFLGSSFGRQSFRGSVTQTTVAGPQTATVDVKTFYATPRLGWLWARDGGPFFAFDAGVQLKLGASKDVQVPPAAPQSVRDNANTLVDLAASYPLPALRWQAGWLF